MAEEGWSTTGAVAGGLGAAGGTGLISSLFSAFGPTRKYQKKARSYKKAMARAAVEKAVRDKDQFVDKSDREREHVQQALASRNLGRNSSIPTEDMAYFERARGRAIEDMDTNIALAQQGQQLLNYEIRAQRFNQYMSYVDQLLGVAGGTLAGGL